MGRIVAGILSLMQHQDTRSEQERYRLDRCLCCGRAHPQLHGGYPRKADRASKSGGSLNPIFIQRYYCPSCQRTCSSLPECIPPRRWYLWEVQQVALALVLAGRSLRAIAEAILPSRHTISRWIKRFKEQWPFHKDVLCNHFADLGLAIDFNEFWQACLNQVALAQAMRLCHAAGVLVP